MWSRPSKDQQRLLRQVNTFTIAALVLIVGACAVGAYIAAALIAAAFVVFYLFWVRRLTAGLEPSSERLSMQESFTSQAMAHSPKHLWAMEIASIALLFCAIAMLGIEPDNRLTAIAAIAFFGLTTASFSWMLIIRRRATRQTIH